VRAKDGVGKYGERIAVRHLHDAGLTIIDTNWRCELGEIDIVAIDGDTLVFCEVKTRSTLSYGTPAEALTPEKVRRLWRLAARFLEERHLRPANVRIDLVAVIRRRRGAARVEHVPGIC
jgi:putative endonuclease